MLQGVWGVTGTGIPCFCREKGETFSKPVGRASLCHRDWTQGAQPQNHKGSTPQAVAMLLCL